MAEVVAALLAWYAEHGRDLPWRRTRDPYAILVSEVMLQQTQVERVVPKYRQFLARFPDLPALAAAAPAEVIRIWAPLGYNRRAIRLWRIARTVVAEHGGRLPTDPAALRRLEGVGEYTAAAMASFAFGQDVAVVDTNVRRVLGRLFWGQSSIAPGPSPRRIHGLAQRLLPPGQAAAWNQALMDLGAKVCLSRKPRCAACPLRPACKAAGTFMSGRAAIAEGRARYQTSRFQGSTRYYRGRILQRLREAADGQGLSLLQLGNGLKPGFAEADLAWLEGLVAGLERDGLARRTPQGVSLP